MVETKKCKNCNHPSKWTPVLLPVPNHPNAVGQIMVRRCTCGLDKDRTIVPLPKKVG